jgi:hypothetical protein
VGGQGNARCSRSLPVGWGSGTGIVGPGVGGQLGQRSVGNGDATVACFPSQARIRNNRD